MVKEDLKSFNFAALEQELAAAVEADAKYKRENDAKLRAVAQGVPSYDQFVDLVAASHLKPLDNIDLSNLAKGPRQQPWNSFGKVANTANADYSTSIANSSCAPKDVTSFSKTWSILYRSKDHINECYSFLKLIFKEHSNILLNQPISTDIFCQVILILSEIESPSYDVFIYILEILTTTKRFSLTVAFLSKEEKSKMKKIFNLLIPFGELEEVKVLASKYGIDI